MSIYGIELLEDNVQLWRENLSSIFEDFVNEPPAPVWIAAARNVVNVNIVHADALSMEWHDGSPLIFPEWGYLGKGKFQRRDFKYDNLTQRSSFNGALFDEFEPDQIFVPVKTYVPMTVHDIALMRE